MSTKSVTVKNLNADALKLKKVKEENRKHRKKSANTVRNISEEALKEEVTISDKDGYFFCEAYLMTTDIESCKKYRKIKQEARFAKLKCKICTVDLENQDTVKLINIDQLRSNFEQ